MASIDYGELVRAEQRRAVDAQRRLDARYARAQELAVEFARTLHRGFGATEVLLFGSALDRYRFALRSDIDIAARGIASDRFWAAYGLAMDAEIPIDLLDLDKDAIRGEVRRSIEREGVRLE